MPATPAYRAFLSRHRTALILLFLCALTTLVYWPGLGGPFLLDDQWRITNNPQVHITSLSLSSLEGAWRSLYFVTPPPGARQLTQLTLALNYYFGGLSTWGYKATNLVIHLLNGCLLFLLARLLARAWARTRTFDVADDRIDLFALASAGLWLVHPLNLTSVLYINQRSEELSATFMLLSMWLYVGGRLALARGEGGWARILSAFPVALFGMLAKSNAALFPVFALVLEWTLLRGLIPPRHPRRLYWLIGLGIVLPIAIGTAYLFDHPSLYTTGYAMRSFDLEQRVLTEARVLWYYLQLMITPTPQALGLFHDDFPMSHGLFQPASTAIAVAAWLLVTPAALLLARRLPWFAFAVLFYLGGQSMESSIIPLELVYEHRNYLPMIGMVMLLARFLMLPLNIRTETRRLFPALLVVLGGSFAALTMLRAHEWRSGTALTFSEAEHHPNSVRSSFKLVQLYIDMLAHRKLTEKQRQEFYQGAKTHLARMVKECPDSLDALFGQLVLALTTKHQPDPALVQRILHLLRHGVVGPTRLTLGQFTYLVSWQVDEPYKLDQKVLSKMFTAILANPGLGPVGAANIHYIRARYEYLILQDKQLALKDMRAAVRLSPTRWVYPDTLIKLNVELGHPDEAAKVLDQAFRRGLNGPDRKQAEALAKYIEQAKKAAAGKTTKELPALTGPAIQAQVSPHRP